MSAPVRSTSRPARALDYPTRDGKPMAETPLHRDNMLDAIERLRRRYAGDPSVYVSGNMLMYYVEGDKRKHVAPDVFVSLGVGDAERDAYFVWEEGKGPDIVIEFTSASTKKEDLRTKFELYRDELKVPEYVLFDPRGEYLTPRLQGFRLVAGAYEGIEAVEGRLPSVVLGLHIEAGGRGLRFHDPVTGEYVCTPAEAERERAEAERDEERRLAEAEQARLRREVEELRRRLGDSS